MKNIRDSIASFSFLVNPPIIYSFLANHICNLWISNPHFIKMQGFSMFMNFLRLIIHSYIRSLYLCIYTYNYQLSTLNFQLKHIYIYTHTQNQSQSFQIYILSYRKQRTRKSSLDILIIILNHFISKIMILMLTEITAF